MCSAERVSAEPVPVLFRYLEDGHDYPEVVRFEIEEQDLPSYLRAAEFLNINDVDIVCLQHEFGIIHGGRSRPSALYTFS
jgi:hypothetical protein